MFSFYCFFIWSCNFFISKWHDSCSSFKLPISFLFIQSYQSCVQPRCEIGVIASIFWMRSASSSSVVDFSSSARCFFSSVEATLPMPPACFFPHLGVALSLPCALQGHSRHVQYQCHLSYVVFSMSASIKSILESDSSLSLK